MRVDDISFDGHRLEPLVEPVHVQQLSAAMRPYVHGLSLCGAGGGGFMICITKEPVRAQSSTIACLHVK